MQIPSHLLSPLGCSTDPRNPICYGCPGAVQQAPTGRWFITMGHPGFNSPANNRNGYATWQGAANAIARYHRA